MRGCLGLVGVLAFLGMARAEEGNTGIYAVSCVQGYAKAFADLNSAADAVRLKAGTADRDVQRMFGKAPVRCEPGAYDYYLNQLMTFIRRAMNSGATPQSPKDGWVRAAADAAGYGPKQVPQAEYYEDTQRYQAARKEVVALAREAGLGPLPSALLVAFDRGVPAPGAYGPRDSSASATTATATATATAGSAPYVSTVPARPNVPGVPLPDWAVANIYEMLEMVKQGRGAEAQAKLEPVLRWIEAQR